MKDNKNFTQKELGIILNNAVASILNSTGLKGTTEARKRQLRSYLSAILDSILEHRKNGHLTSEELVFVLTAGALFVHVFMVSKSGVQKLAQYEDIAVDIANDLDELEGEKRKKKKSVKS